MKTIFKKTVLMFVMMLVGASAYCQAPPIPTQQPTGLNYTYNGSSVDNRTINGRINVCYTDTANYLVEPNDTYDTVNPAGWHYLWWVDNGTIITPDTLRDVTVRWNVNGVNTGTIYVTVTQPGVESSYTDSMLITIHPLPDITVYTRTINCRDDLTVADLATSTTGEVTLYRVFSDDGDDSNDTPIADAELEDIESGFIFIAVSTSPAGCRTTGTDTVKVNSLPNLATSVPAQQCPGTAIDLSTYVTADPGNTLTYYYDAAATQPMPSTQTYYTTPKTYYVTLTTSGGCTTHPHPIHVTPSGCSNITACGPYPAGRLIDEDVPPTVPAGYTGSWEIQAVHNDDTSWTSLTLPYPLLMSDDGKKIRYTITDGVDTKYSPNVIVLSVTP
ncbi:MAG: hypothetical protein LBR66_04140 [Candidatus Symbiothrix sp.]|jgi:hypothetical protein|nr:hypothetical protein [Candidatus Symbiothrix sp.]